MDTNLLKAKNFSPNLGYYGLPKRIIRRDKSCGQLWFRSGSGQGRACLFILPLGVSGSVSNVTNISGGTIYSGNFYH